MDSGMVVAGCDFTSEKFTLMGDMYGRELSE